MSELVQALVKLHRERSDWYGSVGSLQLELHQRGHGDVAGERPSQLQAALEVIGLELRVYGVLLTVSTGKSRPVVWMRKRRLAS